MHIYHFFFFFNDTATTEIYTLSLHDALPICICSDVSRTDYSDFHFPLLISNCQNDFAHRFSAFDRPRSEEHTSELQSRQYLVCRLLLEKKKNTITHITHLLSSIPNKQSYLSY